MDIRTVNGIFTWTNRRLGFSNIAEKLERFFFKGNLIDFNFSLESSILSTSGSNHYSMALSIKENKKPYRCSFKFEKMCVREESFVEMVGQ